MSKKNKKSFFKKEFKPVIKSNKLLFAALGGAASGIALAGILGSDKAKAILETIENTISEVGDRINTEFGKHTRNGSGASEAKPNEPVRFS
ncbi:MAG: hypothetical protein WKF87_08090 [Chryseolinea sp.]